MHRTTDTSHLRCRGGSWGGREGGRGGGQLRLRLNWGMGYRAVTLFRFVSPYFQVLVRSVFCRSLFSVYITCKPFLCACQHIHVYHGRKAPSYFHVSVCSGLRWLVQLHGQGEGLPAGEPGPASPQHLL